MSPRHWACVTCVKKNLTEAQRDHKNVKLARKSSYSFVIRSDINNNLSHTCSSWSLVFFTAVKVFLWVFAWVSCAVGNSGGCDLVYVALFHRHVGLLGHFQLLVETSMKWKLGFLCMANTQIFKILSIMLQGLA